MASRTCSSSRGDLGDDDPMASVTTLSSQICLNCSRAQRPKGGRDDNAVTNRWFANRYRVNQYTLEPKVATFARQRQWLAIIAAIAVAAIGWLALYPGIPT